jgi:hypothetical protein
MQPQRQARIDSESPSSEKQPDTASHDETCFGKDARESCERHDRPAPELVRQPSAKQQPQNDTQWVERVNNGDGPGAEAELPMPHWIRGVGRLPPKRTKNSTNAAARYWPCGDGQALRFCGLKILELDTALPHLLIIAYSEVLARRKQESYLS